MTKVRGRKYFWFSILMHSLILLCGIYFYKNTSKFASYHMVPVYSVPNMTPATVAADLNLDSSSLNHQVLNNQTNHQNLSLFNKTVSKPVKGSYNHPIARNDMLNESKTPPAELLKIIHQAIADKQIYPDNAIELNQKGIVTVEFELQTNGILTNVVIEKSSGYQELDIAALNAVRDASPLQKINKYLIHQQKFRIKVKFDM